MSSEFQSAKKRGLCVSLLGVSMFLRAYRLLSNASRKLMIAPLIIEECTLPVEKKRCSLVP